MQLTSSSPILSDQYHQFGRLLGQAARLLTNRVNFAFRQAGYELTIEQWTILSDLVKQDGVNQQVFADRSAKNKASITSLINNLERKGWVTRKPDKDDRRSNRIFITLEGANVFGMLSPILHETLEQTLEPFSDSEMTVGMEMMNSLVHSLQHEEELEPVR